MSCMMNGSVGEWATSVIPKSFLAIALHISKPLNRTWRILTPGQLSASRRSVSRVCFELTAFLGIHRPKLGCSYVVVYLFTSANKLINVVFATLIC